MDASIIVPYETPGPALDACLEGVRAQRYTAGRIEVLLVAHGAGRSRAGRALAADTVDARTERAAAARTVEVLEVASESPYVARNLAASRARGDVLLFTEPGCVPDPEWVGAHVERLRDPAVTTSVGRVGPLLSTRLVETFLAYEDIRDVWVFSSESWRHYFGRPKNMAISRRRFESHGPFKEVMRGADSSFVQRVASEIGCHEIALTPAALVRQRSITGLPSFLRDRYDHAHALQRHRSSHAAPIAFPDRVELFRETVARNGYGPLRTVTLLALLAAGIFTFRLGGWTAALRPAIPPASRR